jgi:YVTN family beta-propeller protein
MPKWIAPLMFAAAAIFALVMLAFHWPVHAQASKDAAEYLSPGEIAVSADGRRLYVLCERSDELRVVDAENGSTLKSIAVGHIPRGLALSPDGRHVYVSNSWDDSVSVIDAANLALIRTLPTGWEPTGLVTDQADATLYVANRLSDDISVIDLASGREVKRISAGRGASYLTRSADGNRIYCTHVYPNLRGARQAPESEITIVDTTSQEVVERRELHNVGGVFHLALSTDGRLGVAAQMRPKNLIPVAHVEHGWVCGNSITLFGADAGGTVQVPLDELDRYFAMPFGIAIGRDKSKIYVSTSGSDSVTVVSVAKLLEFTGAHREPIANDLSASAHYVTARIPVGKNPRGMTLSPDGRRLYVVNRMDDSISVIDTASDTVASTIDLGGPSRITARRKGEQIFYSARYAFQGQFGCANCHIDATFDGMQWDLEPDGFGKEIVDNRSIESLSGTEPFKWNGANRDLLAECGPRTAMYFYRSQSYDERELNQLASFVMAIPLRPNRYRLPGGELTAAQARGKAIFERTRYKNGRPLPRHNQCAYCHRGPKYTNRKLSYVGTFKDTDVSEMLDVPHLTNDAYSAPYLHDGSARTLEELWTVFNPNDAHGVTGDLTPAEINDLVEYLKSL